MSYDETLVGGLAIIIACVAIGIAAGPWQTPYKLRTISLVSDRFGKPAARSVWFAIALAALAAGIAIINGVRPSYATTSQQTSLER
ncbi:MAG: hypothetical protein WBD20_18220 [Pirellulaceae bacterium]